ncbi:DUF4145 domain-containing protein [Pseudomonas juntendi]|uniref:DUF4145 domain-containing protein n=1 Tax=Pseudomonas juntendi TaxID=2666183 RepID=UPI0032084523
MDWLQFISSITSSLAWPAAVLIMVALLREPLGKVIPLIRTLKYKEWQIDVGHELEAAREKAKENGDPVIDVPVQPTPTVQQIAEIDPRAAVLTTWAPVELGLKDLGLKSGAYKVGVPLYVLIKRLHDQQMFDDKTFEVLQRLSRIRNEAVHLGNISFDEAISMSEMCDWTLMKLKAAGAEI